MSEQQTLTFRHAPATGTVLEGSSKGDGAFGVLKDLRAQGRGNWRYHPEVGIYLRGSREKTFYRVKSYVEEAAEALRAAGFAVETEHDSGPRRTFGEAEADRYGRAENRAEYHGEKAGNAAARSDAAFKAEHSILDRIPPGQPILIGHHSERRHRRDLKRADAHRDRAMFEAGKARYHADREKSADQFRAGREALGTTRRRIERLEAEERGIVRNLDGYTFTRGGYRDVHRPAAGDYREDQLFRLEQVRDELGYWRAHVEALQNDGVKIWTADDFKKGDLVQHSTGWYEVIRVNKKSLTVPDYFIKGRTMTMSYDRVTGRKGMEDAPPRE
jgi:biotin operon repressor